MSTSILCDKCKTYHYPELPCAQKEIDLMLSEMDFLILHESLNLAPIHKLSVFTLGKRVFNCTEQHITLLLRKMDYIKRKLETIPS